MSAKCKPSRTGRVAAQGASVVASGLLMLGLGAGVATASGDDSNTMQNSDSGESTSQSLVDLSHNNIPIQACHNQVPTNALGVQVPIKDVTGSLGLGAAGQGSAAPIAEDNSCNLPAAQQN